MSVFVVSPKLCTSHGKHPNLTMDEEPVQDSTTNQVVQFDKKFSSREPIFYFYHVIDPETATLQVQVLGPNLSATFSHNRAITQISAPRIQESLIRKTTGFLVLIPPGGSTRTVLAWSESGHGLNSGGEYLDARPGILSNALWTKRAIRFGRLMNIGMGHPFDRLSQGGREGMFRASHVELKLAVHAIYALLRIFKITRRNTHVTRRDLQKLRSKTWADGSRPQFEIYFSKKNCVACATFVKALETTTGVSIKLVWKDRLVKIEYASSPSMDVRPPPTILVVDDEPAEVITIGSEAAATVAEDEAAQTVDLTDESEDERQTPLPLGTYIDGLAYCVGQRANSWRRVTAAIVGLAGISRRQRVLRRGGREASRVRERAWLATPPPSRERVIVEAQGDEQSTFVAFRGGNGARARSPRQYSLVSGERVALGR